MTVSDSRRGRTKGPPFLEALQGRDRVAGWEQEVSAARPALLIAPRRGFRKTDKRDLLTQAVEAVKKWAVMLSPLAVTLRVCDFFELRLRCSHNQLPSCSHPSGWVEGDGIRSERGDRFFVTALAFSSSPDGLRGSLGQQRRGEVHHVVGQSTPECNAAGFGQPSDRNAT